MSRLLSYGLLGFGVTAIGHFIGLSMLGIIIGLCLAYIFVSIIEWSLT